MGEERKEKPGKRKKRGASLEAREPNKRNLVSSLPSDLISRYAPFEDSLWLISYHGFRLWPQGGSHYFCLILVSCSLAATPAAVRGLSPPMPIRFPRFEDSLPRSLGLRSTPRLASVARCGRLLAPSDRRRLVCEYVSLCESVSSW